MGQKLNSEKTRKIAESLWDTHGAAIYRFALRLSGNRQVAEDLASETILAALGALHRIEPVKIQRPYLFGITLNKFRRLRRISSEPITDLIQSTEPNVDALLDLERAYRRLPRKLQEAFVLVKAEGLTSKEAGEVLGVPQGTVQARVHEAVLLMRKFLGNDISIAPTLREAQS